MINKGTLGVVLASIGAGLCTAIASYLQVKQAADDCYDEFANEIKLRDAERTASELSDKVVELETDR